MPIYEYRCEKCQKIIEVMQKFSDKPLSRCPSCAGRVSRIISNCSFQLKGTGWYVTDYKKGDSGWKDNGSEEKKTESSKTEPSKTESSKTEPSKTDPPKSEGKETKKERKAEKESKTEAKTA